MKPRHPKKMKKAPINAKNNSKSKQKSIASDEWDDDESDEGDNEQEQESNETQNESIKWYQELKLKYEPTKDDALDKFAADALRREAGKIFEKEVTESIGKQPKLMPRSDFAWMRTVLQKGTVSDKIAAYVLLIQDNPVVNLNHLRNLVSMIKVGKKRECFMAMDTLVELFLDTLLPPNRKLMLFTQKPLGKLEQLSYGNPERRRRLLLFWFFEEQLKMQYSAFLAALNEAAHDTVDANKERAIVAMNKLLQGHPEQEATILANMVNKLGDPSHKIGSKVIYTLTQLLDVHPAMKGVVMEEVEKVIFRPNMSKRAQYYSICFLSQFGLDSADQQLASSLISVYFSLFKACIKTGEMDSRMMGALLTGVSRAYPFAKTECTTLKEHINTVYKVVHLSGSNVSIHALSLLYLVDGETLSQRFMSVLYKKVGEPAMYHGAHHAMFMSIIFKTLKRDSEDSRVCAFIKRLLQVCVHLPVHLVCGLLMLISQIIHGRKNFKLRMIDESTPVLKLEDEDEDDGEECYKDAPVEGRPLQFNVEQNEIAEEKPSLVASSWVHAALKPTQTVPKVARGNYDPYQRNPQHADGDKALPVELIELARHFHPTVALFAANILEGSKIRYTGDPLQDFTLIRFLDKFVFKNPKQISTTQQVTTFSRFGRKKFYSSVGVKRLRANTAEYLDNEEKVIPVDEKFLYKYLKEKGAEQAKLKKEKPEKDGAEETDESDVESVDDDEFDSILNQVASGEESNLNFMDEMSTLPAPKKGKGKMDEDENEGSDEMDEEDEDEEDWSDNEAESDLESNAEDFDGDELDDDFDDGDEFGSDDDDTMAPLPSAKRKMMNEKKTKKKSSGLFAAAEEFADILENEDHYQSGTSSAVSRKDNAGVKQLAWEAKRNDSWQRNSRNSTQKNNKKNFANKRKAPQQGNSFHKKEESTGPKIESRINGGNEGRQSERRLQLVTS